MSDPAIQRGYRFATIPEWILYHPELNGTAVRVYGCLDRHGQDPSTCYPSHARVGALLGMSERSVAKPLAELEAVGAIEVVARFEGGRQTSNGYTLAGDVPLTAQDCVPAPADLRGSGRADERGQGRAGSRDEREQEEREQEERGDLALALDDAPPPKVDLAAGFVRFWEAYPRKTGKGAARTAFTRAVEKASLEEICSSAAAFARFREGEDPKFTPHPTTWLNQERWTDELPGRARRQEAGPGAVIGRSGEERAEVLTREDLFR